MAIRSRLALDQHGPSAPVAFETPDERASRYLADGRVRVLRVDAQGAEATCRGHRATYRVGYSRADGWWCDCDTSWVCPHMLALAMITGAPRPT